VLYNLGVQLQYDLAAGVDPVNPRKLYIGGDYSVRTTDGGRSWQVLDSQSGTNYPNHSDHHGWAFSPGPAVNSFVYDASDGGVWKMYPKDDGAGGTIYDWTNLNTSTLTTIESVGAAASSYGIALPTGATHTVSVYVEGSQDNGLAAWSDNQTDHKWQKVYYPFGDGGPVRFTSTGYGYAFRFGSTPKMLYSKPAQYGKVWQVIGDGDSGLPPGTNNTADIQFSDNPGFALERGGIGFYLGGQRLWRRRDPTNIGDWEDLTPVSPT
jgi:hypothetical protein